MVLRRRLLFSGLCLLYLTTLGCSSAPLNVDNAKACLSAKKALKDRVGPELGKVSEALPIPLSQTSFGCGLIFTRIDEELPGEVSGVYGQSASQELAISLPNGQAGVNITLIPPPPYRAERVRLALELKELRGGGAQELIVTERATKSVSQYQGFRVFAFAEGVPSPREILSEPLRFKTVDGIPVTGRWGVERFEEEEVILIQGGGEYRVYQWHDSLQSFKLDLAASTRYKQGQSKPR
jgi:hypothetical protein